MGIRVIILLELLFLGSMCCTHEWIEYNGVWYFLSEETFTFTDAISYCKEEGAYIAIITDEIQNDFLKDNDMFGWIGLTNTVINNYSTPITGHSNKSEDNKSFKDGWYWTVVDWDLFDNGDFNPSRFYVNLFDANATVDEFRSAFISDHTYWRFTDPSNKLHVVCEWQCRSIGIHAPPPDKLGGVYHRTRFHNQRWEYVVNNTNTPKRLNYVDYRDTDQWTIEIDSQPIVFLRETPHSPIYNYSKWINMSASFDIQLVCFSDFVGIGQNYLVRREAHCNGFYVYRNVSSMQFIYMNRIKEKLFWCISDSLCIEDNNTLCNTKSSPFPDVLTGYWVRPEQLESYEITTDADENRNNNDSNAWNFTIYISIGCVIGGLIVILIIIVLVVIIRKRKSRTKTSKCSQQKEELNKPEFKDYSYVFARDITQQNGANDNIEMTKIKNVCTENENNHTYSLEKIPQVNTSPNNDDISKQIEYNTNINKTCDTYEDIESIHNQNPTDSDKAKAQGLVDNSPKPVKPPRTFAHESVYSDEESPPPPVPSKGILDSGNKTVFDNVVFDKDEGHDIELFENTIYETNVTT